MRRVAAAKARGQGGVPAGQPRWGANPTFLTAS